MATGDRRPSALRAYELGALDDLTDPAQFWPCGHCEPWHIEIYRGDDDEVAVREWHDAHCPHLLALLRDDEADAALA